MLDVGFSEILLTSAIALIVLGPERLPKVARQVGNWLGRARAMARQLSEQLEREVSADELLKTQSKSDAGLNRVTAAGSGGAYDPAYTPSIAPPPATAPPTNVAPPTAEAPPAIEAAPAAAAPPSAPEPTYGLAASATTPAAMHASDPAEPHPPHD
jgi:sec-independent protein translocase protein TatB